MEELTESNESNDSEFILSMCWDCGYLSAVYYNVETMELHVSLKSVSFLKIFKLMKFKYLQQDYE